MASHSNDTTVLTEDRSNHKTVPVPRGGRHEAYSECQQLAREWNTGSHQQAALIEEW